MSTKTIISLIITVGVVILFIILFLFAGDGGEVNGNNVYMEGDTQIVEITARGGYFPRKSVAVADTPTTVRVKTSGTFDCSALLVIPSLNYRQMLPASGTTDIPLGIRKSGAKIQGACGMGMYNFTINFK